MADQARKKQKQRLKREQKRRELRKSRGAGPARLFADGGLVACYVNSDWRERGQAAAFVLRRARDGRLGMATFMIDLWCAGLKDAWGRVGLTREEFEEVVDHMDATMDGTMDDAALPEVAALVAGAIRFARQNGFRLPAHHDRWAALLGELHPETADLSGFGYKEQEGKTLCWVGPMHDLRARLIGSTVEHFLTRPDVAFVLGVEDGAFIDEFYGDDDGGDDSDEEFDEELDEEGFEATAAVLDKMVEDGTASLRRWCFANGRVPEARIDAALPLVIARGFTSVIEGEVPSGEADRQVQEVRDKEREYLDSLPEAERLRVITAIAQVEEFLKGVKTPADLVAAFGLPGADGDGHDDDDS
jgi:hypothetical protein